MDNPAFNPVGHLNTQVTPLASMFREVRKRLGLNQADLAEAMGVQRQTIVRIETGVSTDPRDETLYRFQQAILDLDHRAELTWATLERARELSRSPDDLRRDQFWTDFESWYNSLPERTKSSVKYMLVALRQFVEREMSADVMSADINGHDDL